MKLRKDSKVLVTGGAGMLGDAVYKLLKDKTKILVTDINVKEKYIQYLDVRERNKVNRLINIFKPDLVFHLAALTDLEECELNINNARETNFTATKNLATICQKSNIPLIYISTAGIFNGKKDYYTEKDTPSPINIYGQTKYAGELSIKNILNKFYIFRAGWMMGGGPEKDKKFVNKVLKQIIAGRKQLFVVDDKSGTPTYTFDFVKNMLAVIDKDLYGIYHLVCQNDGTRYDVACEIIKIIHRNDIKIIRVKSDYFHKEYFAHRPSSEKLIPRLLQEIGLYKMRSWKTCLKEYLPLWNQLLQLT